MNGTTNMLTSPHYALGLCSGPTVFNGATSQFVGMISWVGIGGSVVYNAGPPAFFSSRHYVGAKVGASIYGTTGNYSDVNNSYATNSYVAEYENAGVPMRDLMFITITRPGGATGPTSGLYTVDMFLRSSSGVFVDASFSDFTTQAIAATPAHGGHTNYGNNFSPYLIGTGTINVNESGISPLDHVMFGWDRSAATIEVSDIGVVKLL